jgi:hypothetical protein
VPVGIVGLRMLTTNYINMIITTTKKYTAACNFLARQAKKQDRIVKQMVKLVERGELDPDDDKEVNRLAEEKLKQAGII